MRTVLSILCCISVAVLFCGCGDTTHHSYGAGEYESDLAARPPQGVSACALCGSGSALHLVSCRDVCWDFYWKDWARLEACNQDCLDAYDSSMSDCG